MFVGELWLGVDELTKVTIQFVTAHTMSIQIIVKEVIELLVEKDSKVGDLLELMRPAEGKHEDVNIASDLVVKIQADLDQKLTILNQKLRSGDGNDRALLPFNSRTLTKLASSDRVSFDIAEIEDEMETELKDLKSSLTAVTSREKERIESLQVCFEDLCCPPKLS